jgi:hypothetical protein
LVNTQPSKQFNDFYPALAQGTYNIHVTCSNPSGNLEEKFSVLLDFDTRITNPGPSGIRRSNELVFMGIDVRDDAATCEYRNIPVDSEEEETGSWKTFPQNQSRSEGYYRHQTIIPTKTTGFYLYDVRCKLSNGVLLPGNASDRIAFAIDDQKPILEVTTLDEDGNTISVQGGELPVSENGRELTITCNDPEIIGIEQSRSGLPTTEKNHASGNIDTGKIQIFKNTNTPADTGERTITDLLREDETRVYSCQDGLGNTAGPIVITSELEDTKGPERPDFEGIS